MNPKNKKGDTNARSLREGLACYLSHDLEPLSRDLLELAPIGYLVINDAGEIIDANRFICQVLGLEREQLLGKPFISLILPRQREKGQRLLESLLRATGPSQVTGIEWATYDENYWFVSTGYRVGSEGASRVVIFSVDVTKRKHAEQALRESEALFRNLLENGPEPIVITTFDKQITWANKAFYQWLGYTEEDIARGLGIPELVAPEDQAMVHRVVEARMAGQSPPQRNIFSMVHKDGHHIPVETSATLIEYHDQPAELISIRDISELRAAERELEASHAQLRSLLQRLENIREEERARIARRVHDELGQALTALKLDLASVRRRVLESHIRSRELEARFEDMVALIDETIHAVQSISAELRPATLSEAGLAAAIEWLVDQHAWRTQMECTVDIDPEDMTVEPPLATTLFRICQELLTNTARHAQAKRVHIQLHQRPSAILLEVWDDGRGMDAEATLAPTSLGFANIRERLIPWKGTISFHSAAGAGTRVTITIPLSLEKKQGENHDSIADR